MDQNRLRSFFLQNKVTYISWILVFFWMCIIFALSSQPSKESTELSESITIRLLQQAEKTNVIPSPNPKIEKQAVSILNQKIREMAHSIVFLVLSLLVSYAFFKCGYKGLNAFVYTCMFCFVYAWFDEIHQLFVPGRATEFFDLSLDWAGIVLGTVVFSVIVHIRFRRQFNAIRTNE